MSSHVSTIKFFPLVYKLAIAIVIVIMAIPFVGYGQAEKSESVKRHKLTVYRLMSIPLDYDYDRRQVPYFIVENRAVTPLILYASPNGEPYVPNGLIKPFRSGLLGYFHQHGIQCSVGKLAKDVEEKGGCGEKCWDKVVKRLTGNDPLPLVVCSSVIEFSQDLDTWLNQHRTTHMDLLTKALKSDRGGREQALLAMFAIYQQ